MRSVAHPPVAPSPRRWLPLGAIVVLLVLSTPGAFATRSSSAAPVSAVGVGASPVDMGCLPIYLETPGGPCPTASGLPGANASTAASWVDVTATAGTPPSQRSYTRSFAFDPVDHYLVTFGGYIAGTYANDTWVYNGSWHQLHPAISPSGRDHSTLVWDPVDQYLLLFGGSGLSGADSDTWTFLGGSWTHLTPAHHPSARWASDVVWDASDGYALLFGGCANGEVNDSWKYLGGSWTNLSIAHAPSPRGNVAMAYDATFGRVVLFGGDDWYSHKFGDTWSYSGGNWTNLSLVHAPSARSMASFAYDPAVHADVLFGGEGVTADAGDTWWFSNGTWQIQAPLQAPGARYFGILADYPIGNAIILWGGVGQSGNEMTDTWSYYSVGLSVEVAQATGPAPFNATFTATPVGGLPPYAVTWAFGDGSDGVGSPTNHTYPNVGAYQAIATVTDANGVSTEAGTWVQVLPPLSANGVVAPLAGTAPLTIFAAASWSGGQSPVESQWDFGGIGSASGASANFTFSVPGDYQVSLSVSDSAGEVREVAWTVVVSPQPHPAMSTVVTATRTSGLAPLTVEFHAEAVGGSAPFRYAWDLGDGTVSSLSDVNHTYSAVGIYPVAVTISDSFGTSVTRALSIAVDPPLTATAGALPTNGTAPLTVSFGGTAVGGTPGYTFVWNFGDGNASVGQSAVHTYGQEGTYAVSLQVWDASGATASAQLTVTVGAAPVNHHPPPAGATNTTSAATAQLSLPAALGVSLIVAIAAAVATAVVMRRRR